MADFAVIENSFRRALLLAAGISLSLLAVTVACLTFTFSATGQLHEFRAHTPILVVPGAVAGVYSPGLTEENVMATARYLTGLATNFGGVRSLQERFDELETYASGRFLPFLQQARLQLQRAVDSQNQSRSFFASPQSEVLRQSEPGHFEYSVSGQRLIYASGLPMDSRKSEVRLKLLWGQASARNRAGIVLDGLDVRDIAPIDARNAADASGNR